MKHLKRDYFVSPFALTPQMLLLLSSLVYFVPFVTGGFQYVDVGRRKYDFIYHAGTGYAIALSLSCIAAAMLVFMPRRQDFEVEGDVRGESIVIIVMLVVFGGISIANPALFSASKADVLSSTGRIQYVFYNSCIIGMVFGALSGWKKSRLVIILSCLGLMLTLYIGHRSSVAIAILACLYIRYRNISLLLIRKRYIIGGIGAFFFLAVYKAVYAAIKAGNFELVGQKIQFDQLSDSALVGLEQFVTLAHLDLVVKYDYTLPCSNLWLVPFSLFPFSDTVFGKDGCTYNEQVQPFLFPGYSGGVAANIWAEFFANFGYAGFPLLVVILSLVCVAVEAIIRNVRSATLKAGLIVAIVHLTFYIQRKELLGAFISAKRAVLVALFIFGLVYVHRKCFPPAPAEVMPQGARALRRDNG
ncbi:MULTISPECIES: hypothetical protein [unclassified Mesorhizobium]|uniref:hypothetical protein n=1 Tax=unclassified Mesorhizobium TaxID=325217 RepID=UPI00112D0C9E|nr:MULTISPECIES: hypothetical protein [unclassified Mesorhizobium]TPK59321.1 hypothetical protein FJ551_24285 [Mesorhizobium sp. B2-5-1]TPM65144.1 hypothetical protein FJ962_06875 [Mesorhizobium sp. B2-1-9]TPM86749.1 hypothetical protein FJ963_09570 [Mesorhizobium sp. B2-1-4]TPN14270.1 hypothetical protein FJ971_01470 [Mesorhizobium sp. B2-1-2]UCI12340.1 hypothetical protein FJ972_22460 [Mesorhizobium sp. B2-1-1]